MWHLNDSNVPRRKKRRGKNKMDNLLPSSIHLQFFSLKIPSNFLHRYIHNTISPCGLSIEGNGEKRLCPAVANVSQRRHAARKITRLAFPRSKS